MNALLEKSVENLANVDMLTAQQAYRFVELTDSFLAR